MMEHDICNLWDTELLTPEAFFMLSKKNQLRYIINFGILAPNTHNAQPWAFSFDESKLSIKVYLNRTRVLPASDKNGRQSVISIGATIENMVTTARHFGMKAEIQILSQEKNSLEPVKNETDQIFVPLADIFFEQTKALIQETDLFASISKRKALRADYDPAKKIPDTILEEIKNSVSQNSNQLHLVNDPLRKQAMAEFQGQADSFVINSKKFREELGAWLLPNETKSHLGMPGIGFGLQSDQAIRIHKGLMGTSPLEPEDGLKFALAGKIAMEKSPFIGFLTSSEDDVHHWIETGRSLQRIFLICTHYGISTAVHAGIVEVSLINRMFAATLGTTKRIMAVFRMGYVKNEKDLERPHTPRLSVDEVLIPPHHS